MRNLYPSFVFLNTCINQNIHCFEFENTEQDCTISNFSLNYPGLMALYIKRPRLEEEWIGRGMPSDCYT